jgi:DNA topoisomerase-1
VHPAVLDSYMDGTMVEGLLARAEEKLAEDLHDLEPEEAAVLAMLQQRLSRDVPEPKKVQSRRKAA